MNYQLDNEIVDFIDNYLKLSSLSTGKSIVQQRIDYEIIVNHYKYPHPPGVFTRDSVVTGRHGDIPLRHYSKEHNSKEHNSPDSQLFFIHGGGFILGSLDSHDDICAELCARTGINLVSVDYRLSPEFYHPTHLDDVEDAFLACWHTNTTLVGISAGANLAAALGHRCKSGEKKPAGQVLIYPALGGEVFDLKSYQDNSNAPLLSTEDHLFYRKVRCATDAIPEADPEFYPLVADNFANLPATVAFSADVDPLRDDAQLYVEKLVAAGGQGEWINEDGLVHDYLRARHISKKAGASFQRICDSIKRLSQENKI